MQEISGIGYIKESVQSNTDNILKQLSEIFTSVSSVDTKIDASLVDVTSKAIDPSTREGSSRA